MSIGPPPSLAGTLDFNGVNGTDGCNTDPGGSPGGWLPPFLGGSPIDGSPGDGSPGDGSPGDGSPGDNPPGDGSPDDPPGVDPPLSPPGNNSCRLSFGGGSQQGGQNGNKGTSSRNNNRGNSAGNNWTSGPSFNDPRPRNRPLEYQWLSSGGGCPPSGTLGGCVAPASRIALFPDGCKMAGEVQVGDILLTLLENGTIGGERVIGIRSSVQPCVRLETEDGRQLLCSLSHEVIVTDPDLPDGKRTGVLSLTLDDRLVNEEGVPVALRSIVRQPEGPVLLLSLEGPRHLYLSNGIWSHNSAFKRPTYPLPPAGP